MTENYQKFARLCESILNRASQIEDAFKETDCDAVSSDEEEQEEEHEKVDTETVYTEDDAEYGTLGAHWKEGIKNSKMIQREIHALMELYKAKC